MLTSPRAGARARPEAAQRQGVLIAVVPPAPIADPGGNPYVDLDAVSRCHWPAIVATRYLRSASTAAFG
ncbi:MAG TPA: hypothetical protein VHH53_09180, partial [Pseudonocardiaceae bacterium]|nr:hypothetical protein [Pseudonocardiaceae bacterium]